jgi:ABC-2 type transport system permease protein
MNPGIIATLVRKDVALFFRNPFFAMISVLGMVAYIAIYFAMPATADEKFTIGLYPPSLPALFMQQFETREMAVIIPESEEALRAGVEDGTFRVGIVMPPEAAEAILSGNEAEITAYFPPGIPAELNDAFADLLTMVFNEAAYMSADQPLRITLDEEVLGYDLSGEALPIRDRMLPLFAVLIFMMETLGLANLIAEEYERGTVRALLITPMKTRELFAGKSITGVLLAFVQALILIAITGKLGINPLLILVALVFGAILVTGVGFLVAAISKDLMSVVSWGSLAMIVLGIPSVSIMFPGMVSDWVRLIPSYYLVDTLHRVLNFGAGWADMTSNLLILLASGLVVLFIGTFVLNRRLQ